MIRVTALVFALALSFQTIANAQPCPGSMIAASMSAGYAHSSDFDFIPPVMTGPLFDFITTGSTGVPSGPMLSLRRANCVVMETIAASLASALFRADWPSPTARTMAGGSHGCRFNCGTGTTARSCFINGLDGLPVELMDFHIDEDVVAEDSGGGTSEDDSKPDR